MSVWELSEGLKVKAISADLHVPLVLCMVASLVAHALMKYSSSERSRAYLFTTSWFPMAGTSFSAAWSMVGVIWFPFDLTSAACLPFPTCDYILLIRHGALLT